MRGSIAVSYWGTPYRNRDTAILVSAARGVGRSTTTLSFNP